MTSRPTPSFSLSRGLSKRFATKGRAGRGETKKLSIESLEAREMMTVDYYGGGVMPNVQTQAVFLGSQWGSNATYYNQTGQLEGFLNNLVGGAYMDMMTNAGYGIGRGSNTTGIIDGISINTSYYLTDAAIQSQLVSEVRAGYLQNPANANRLFVVYVEPGVAISDGAQTSQKNFLGYHSAFNNYNAAGQVVTYHYAVMAYPGGYNPSATAAGWRSNLDQLTSVTSHEVAEAATDPNVTLGRIGWYDYGYGGLDEIGDIAMYDGGYKVARFDALWDGYAVQMLVNRYDQLIAPSGWSRYSTSNAAFGTVAAAGMGNAAPLSQMTGDPDDTDGDNSDGDDLSGLVNQPANEAGVDLATNRPGDNGTTNHESEFNALWLPRPESNNPWLFNVSPLNNVAAVDEVFRAFGH